MPAFDYRTDPSPRPLLATGFFPFPNDLAVMCMSCGAQIGSRCVTSAGKRTQTHSSRVRKFIHHVQWGFVVQVTATTDGVKPGDILVCQPDTTGDTLRALYRVPAGDPPPDRIRTADATFLGWETELDREQVFDRSPGLYAAGVVE